MCAPTTAKCFIVDRRGERCKFGDMNYQLERPRENEYRFFDTNLRGKSVGVWNFREEGGFGPP